MVKINNKITIGRQYASISALKLSDFKIYWVVSGSKFACKFSLIPSPLSGTYKIRLCYQQGKHPDVFVESPLPLKRAEGATLLEHVYSTEKQHLCLYVRKAQEWNDTMFISNTVIPWISEWIFHYELWVLTGVWNGGGIHNSIAEKTKKIE